MPIRDEDLIDYLLGEAGFELQEHIESQLAIDPKLASRLAELRAALGMLDSLQSVVEPPHDLVQNTLNFIDLHSDDSQIPSVEEGSQDRRANSPVGAHSTHHPTSSTVRPSSLAFSPSSRRLNGWDSVMLTLSLVVMGCLFLPLVLEARSQSRRLQCAQQLHLLGQGLTHLAMLDSERRFPAVPVTGPEAFAGVYTLRLHDSKLIESPSQVYCASLPSRYSRSNGDDVLSKSIPTREEFVQATPEQQAYYRFTLGGDYAYNFGVMDCGRVVAPRLEGRTHFAILADAPVLAGDREVFRAHEGRGINIYFEDGHVQFVRSHELNTLNATKVGSLETSLSPAAHDSTDTIRLGIPDHPFRNLEGLRAVGLTPEDAALGTSASSPLPQVTLPSIEMP